MTYPLSSDVSPGDPTAASHYNNLRADALRFGQASADAVNVGALLEWFESRLKIELLSTNRVRVPGSSSEPVGLMVAGYPLRSVANVDLAVGDVPTGGAQTWYIFANRSSSSTTFTLSINVSSTEGVNQRRIGRFYYDGSKIVKDSIRTELSLLVTQLLYFKEPQHQCGRLTLSTGVPIPSTDVSSSSVLYFTPYKGNRVSLYVPGYGWRVYSFSELSMDISGWSDAKNYDVFIYDNSGSLALEGVAWSNDTLRATALDLQDGAYVKSGAYEKLYLGTVRTSSAGTSADTVDKRFVWNNYNRVHRELRKIDSTYSWTYATAAWRKFNNSSSNRLQVVLGLQEEKVYLIFTCACVNSTTGSEIIAFGLDSDSPDSSCVRINSKGATDMPAIAIYDSIPGLGFHYLQMLEYTSAGTGTYYGTGSTIISGALGWINS